ncbi:MAG: glycosyltransferase, partial [Cyanobacteria bacterium J06639_14]
MNKLLSVVTVTHNKGDRNRASIQSILDQTYRDFDYIVVNDGSSDHTKAVLNEFRDPRLKIIHQENKSFVKTMCSVMSQINTPYVAIQGAGDISFPKRFEIQLKYLANRKDLGAVGCNFSYIDEVGKVIKFPEAEYIEYTSVEQMIDRNIFNHGEVMLRLESYRSVGGYRSFFVYSQDRDLWLRLLEICKIARLPEHLYSKVISVGKDISGNPSKVEKQALYSLFNRYLARRRLDNIPDPQTDVEMEALFVSYVRRLPEHKKLEVANEVFRSGVRFSLENSDKQFNPEAAEKEEYDSYNGRMSDRWLEDLKAFGTDWNKPFLEEAPWL